MLKHLVFVQFFSPGTPTPPSTETDQLIAAPKSPTSLSAGNTSPKQTKKTKQKTNNGEMPEWMVNFVTTNNLVVGQDVKLDESKVTPRRRSSTATSGTGTTTKTGTKTGTGTRTGGSPRSGKGPSRPKSRASPGVAKRGGNSPKGSPTPAAERPVTPSKGKSVPQ